MTPARPARAPARPHLIFLALWEAFAWLVKIIGTLAFGTAAAGLAIKSMISWMDDDD